ncbi:MAG: 50S ribosomal protein L11 methyltransferase [Rhodothermales bacterium]
MPTIAFELTSPPQRQEELVAWLDEEEVSGILQEESRVTVYADEACADRVRALLHEAPDGLVEGGITEEEIADRNWNADWERTITPVTAGPFRIRPTWETSAPTQGTVDILIDPKMSFGTGHHESTRLLLSSLAGKVTEGCRVLDAGTGTGVLAFAALHSGADHADAFDYDPLCMENAAENAELNALSDRFHVFQDDGTSLSASLGDCVYDVIMANINREVLRSMLPTLYARLKEGGRLGLAGLLISDAVIMRDELHTLGLDIMEENEEGSWWSVWALRRNDA